MRRPRCFFMVVISLFSALAVIDANAADVKGMDDYRAASKSVSEKRAIRDKKYRLKKDQARRQKQQDYSGKTYSRPGIKREAGRSGN